MVITGTNNTLTLNGNKIDVYTGGNGIKIDNNVISAIVNQIIPPGTIVPYVGNEAPDGWMICDGSPLHDTAETHNLYDKLVHNSNFYRHVHVHSDEKRVYLPDLRGRFIKGLSNASQSSPGVVQDSALPNITGTMFYYIKDEVEMKVPGYASVEAEDKSPFYAEDIDKTIVNVGIDSRSAQSGKDAYGVKMDMSKSNEIYKDDVTEVTPPNMLLNYIIKL